MAKAKPKKDEETPQAKAKPAAEAKAPAASKPKAAPVKKVAAPATADKPKKAAKPASTPAGMSLIDTNLAAQAAAKMVVNRDMLGSAKSAGEKKESGSFKQLKESLLKPAVQGPGGLLSTPNQQKKSNTGFGGRNQVGHNQTFGADVNRTGVPRRTGGG